MRSKAEKLAIFRSADIYCVISSEFCLGRAPEDIVAAAAEGGAKIIQIREKNMSDRNLYSNYDLLQKHDEVKFVISSRMDFDFACSVITQYRLPEKTAHLIASPVWGRIAFEDLAAWIIECELPLRMQLQMHKIIWGDKRGV